MTRSSRKSCRKSRALFCSIPIRMNDLRCRPYLNPGGQIQFRGEPLFSREEKTCLREVKEHNCSPKLLDLCFLEFDVLPRDGIILLEGKFFRLCPRVLLGDVVVAG